MSPGSRSEFWRGRRGSFRNRASLSLRSRARGKPFDPRSPNHPGKALDTVSVVVGLLILTVGTISCAIAGAWAAMVTLLPIGMSLVLVPRRGGREDAPSPSGA